MATAQATSSMNPEKDSTESAGKSGNKKQKGVAATPAAVASAIAAKRNASSSSAASTSAPLAELLYESEDPVLFSQLIDGKLEKRWKSWMPRHVEVRGDGSLIYRQNKGTVAKTTLDVSGLVRLTYIAMDAAAAGGGGGASDAGVGADALLLDDVGMLVECRESGLPTAFKCVLPSHEVSLFCAAIRKVSADHNVDAFLASQRRHVPRENSGGDSTDTSNEYSSSSSSGGQLNRRTGAAGSDLSAFWAGDASSPSVDAARARNMQLMKQQQSVMRRSIAAAIDKHTKRTRIDRVIARRGAFKDLPVAFTNDLVHGSWWYVIGSAFGVVFPLMIILGNHSPDIEGFSYDDDLLKDVTIDTTWILMIVSGVFFTLGSGAFLRAVNDPPMRPLFSGEYFSYHVGTDELLGSWLFVLATLPFVPYSLIFVIAEPTNILFYCLLAVSCLSVLGSLIFLANCYPSEVDRPAYILPLIKLMNCYGAGCCCSEEFIDKHLSNDWLAGTWIIYWVTCFAAVCTTIVFGMSLWSGAPMRIFIDGCTFVDCLMFLVGSVYFVAGSYPVDELGTATASSNNGGGSGSAGYIFNNNRNSYNGTSDAAAPALFRGLEEGDFCETARLLSTEAAPGASARAAAGSKSNALAGDNEML